MKKSSFFNRSRGLLGLSVALLGFCSVSVQAETASCTPAAKPAAIPAPVSSTRPNGATTTVYDLKTVKIHAYTAPSQALRTSTYVIEGPTKLVLIEPQFMNTFSHDFRAYVDSLGKPIDRLLVTDRDPDHYFGLGAGFGDVPAYALGSVISVIEKQGPALLEERRTIFGEEMPAQHVAPTHKVRPGKEVIDCVSYRFKVSIDDEGGRQLSVHLPEYGIIATGDIAMNHCHLIPGPATEKRLTAFAAAAKPYKLVLPSNGVPADGTLFAENLAYLAEVEKNLQAAENAEDYQARMLAAYPDYDCEIFFIFYVPAYFGAP